MTVLDQLGTSLGLSGEMVLSNAKRICKYP